VGSFFGLGKIQLSHQEKKYDLEKKIKKLNRI